MTGKETLFMTKNLIKCQVSNVRLGRFDEPLEDRLGDFGDISERKVLREKLKCRSFKWYLDNVADGLPYHPLIGAGELKNPSSDLCLDKNDRTEHMDEPVPFQTIFLIRGHVYFTFVMFSKILQVDVAPCHGLGGFQYWWMNKNRFYILEFFMSPIKRNISSLGHLSSCLVYFYIKIANVL